MADLSAIVLAAGAGSRLGTGAKPLLVVAGRSLLDRALEILGELGTAEIVIVTGAHADAVTAHAGTRARCVHNEGHQTLDNYLSLRVGLEALEPGRVLVLNGDVIAGPQIHAAVAAGAADLTLAVSAGLSDAEALKVELAQGRPVRMGKQLDAVHGEFVGISALSQTAREAYVEAALRAERGGERRLYYEDIYSRLLSAGLAAEAVDVPAGAWAEVDTPDDVPAAAEVAKTLDT